MLSDPQASSRANSSRISLMLKDLQARRYVPDPVGGEQSPFAAKPGPWTRYCESSDFSRSLRLHAFVFFSFASPILIYSYVFFLFFNHVMISGVLFILLLFKWSLIGRTDAAQVRS